MTLGEIYDPRQARLARSYQRWIRWRAYWYRSMSGDHMPEKAMAWAISDWCRLETTHYMPTPLSFEYWSLVQTRPAAAPAVHAVLLVTP